MCLIGFSLWPDRERPLMLAANRDEYYQRRTQAAHWWPDLPGLFAGRDEEAGGTWMGASRGQRIAAVTNYRDGYSGTGERSRGELVTRALSAEEPVETLLDSLEQSRDDYAGYNLLVFDWSSDNGRLTALRGHYFSNRSATPWRALPPGDYALSNGLLEDPWPKCQRVSQAMASVADQTNHVASATLLKTMTDHQVKLQAGQQLPDTGVGRQAEIELAAPFVHVDARSYGTRCTTMTRLDQNGVVDVEEWSWKNDGTAQLSQRRGTRFTTGA